MSVERFTVPVIESCADGAFVRWSDYDALTAQHATIIASWKREELEWDAERDRLTARVAEQDALIESLQNRWASRPLSVEDTAELEKDAARYRWLRDGNGYAPEENFARGGEDLDRLCDEGIADADGEKR